MTATNETANYKLPLFTDNDQPTWLGDFNGAMNKIDADMNTIGANASTALSAANNAVNRVGQVENTIAGVQTTANNAYAMASATGQDVETLNGQVAQLESKFPVTSDSLANGSVTASKLDQTAIAAMWAGLTVHRFDSKDSTADNTGMGVPSGGDFAGFYIEELGLLVINRMSNETGYTDEASVTFTLPNYVPNFAATRTVADACFLEWNNSTSFDNWTGLYSIKSTRNLRPSSLPIGNPNYTLMGSVVLYVGVNTGVPVTSSSAYQRVNGTVG